MPKKQSKPVSKWGEPIESPLSNYPGAVSYPEYFTLGHFQSWMEYNKQVKPDERTVALYPADDDNGGETWKPIIQEHWGFVKRFCDLSQLENMPSETDDNGRNAPYQVAAWLIPLTNEYLSDQISLKN